MMLDIKRKTYVRLILIALLGVLAYSNTFNVPLQFDDGYHIKENKIVGDIDYFFHPSKAKGLEQYGAMTNRYVGYLRFALNHELHGFDVRGYHLVNIAIHMLNALLVYALVVLTFRTPFMEGARLREYSRYVALLSALLFVSHPVQTEAVTYIFQRLASLVAFFYLLSVVAYAGSRLSGGERMRYALYALSVVSAVLAMKTKENAFTLPLTVALYEVLFFRGRAKDRVIRLVPPLLTMLIIPVSIAGGGLASMPRGYEGVTRGEYLFTQFRVVITYMRLLFVPINQTVDYGYVLSRSFSAPRVTLLRLSRGHHFIRNISASSVAPQVAGTAYYRVWNIMVLHCPGGRVRHSAASHAHR